MKINSKNFLFFIIFFICKANTLLAFDPLEKKREKPLKSLFSMNLQCTKNQWQLRIDQILDTISSLSPDIISFQEVCISKNTNMISYIKKGLSGRGYLISSIESQATHLSWHEFQEYLLIISKHPSSKSMKGLLPKSPLQRGYVSLKIYDTWYINTHLEHRSDYYMHRKKQINFLVSLFKNWPHIIMGDFNSSPKEPEHNSFIKNDYLNFFPPATRPSENPTSAIDGFWISKEISWYYLKSDLKTLFEKPINEIYMSDHLAVYLLANDKDFFR